MANQSKVTDFTIPPNDPSRRKREVEAAEQELTRFYRQQDDNPHALPALVRDARRRALWRNITLSLAGLLVLALGAFFFFTNRSAAKFGEDSIKLELKGPSAAPSGQVAEYSVAYTNDQGVGLTQLEVNFRFPDGFAFESSTFDAANVDHTRYLVRGVPPHGTGQVAVHGRLVGEVGQSKDFGAVVTYRPENINADFTKTLSISTQLVASVLNLDLTAPAQLAATDQLKLTASYHNSSSDKLTGLVIKLTAPIGFTFDPLPLTPVAGTTDTWQLNDLAPNIDGKLDLTGRFAGTVQPGAQTFHLAVGFLPPGSTDFSLQEEKVVTVTLVKSTFNLTLTANDVQLRSVANLGDDLTYDLTYSNDGDTPFTDVVLVAHLSPSFLDWMSLQDSGSGQANTTEGTITWTKTNLPTLALVPPGGRGALRFVLRVKPALPAGVTSGASFSAKVAATANQQINAQAQAVTLESNEVVTKLNSQLRVQTDGRYYTDQLVKIGSGPLPPKVGQTTTYVILWQLTNTINEVDNVQVTTTLPPDVSWTNQTTVTAGQGVTYNPNTREVNWTLNRLPAGAGSVFMKPEATFEVAITPAADDVNKVLVLTKTTTATARDAFSDGDLIATDSAITTEIDTDLAAQGKGTVVP